jgi:ADP-ribose pyrophosphatase YjhB (NUDIX family)
MPAPAALVPHDVLHRLKRTAGGVLWRRVGARLEIALVHRAGRPRAEWSLPKGRLAPGETAVQAAVREVTEETGYRVQRGILLGSVVRSSRTGRSKVTSYWLMRPVGGRFRPGREVDALAWVDLEEAEMLLERRPEATLLESIRGALADDLAAAG